MRKVRVLIRLKPTLMDAQGVVVRKALNELGYDSVTDVRIGKLIELTLDCDGRETQLKAQVEEMCARLLANPVIEEYEVVVE
ncbi:MAG TPA: phosphoribosylformylglycinamidine synthase subunit PurS [Armatimonadetes bacterium]|nr:phosphoribosylformylglycinamidine synthase subunit PurS [Armatimonadota bacterium]